jgi:SAM-dependent methyltransferase
MSTRDYTEWYEEWFDEDYLALYAHRDEAEARRFVAALWESLELAPGTTVADVPCGAGRHCLAFAEKGARVIGLDLSRVMLTRAAETCNGCSGRPLFVRGDLRHVPLTSGFQVVASIFSSLGYFDSESDNHGAFSELVRLLEPGGILIVDVINPPYLRANFVSQTRRSTTNGEVTEWRNLDEEKGRVTKQVQIRTGGGIRTIHESVRLYDQDELARLAMDRGLQTIEFWGDYDGGECTRHSPRLILFARR